MQKLLTPRQREIYAAADLRNVCQGQAAVRELLLNLTSTRVEARLLASMGEADRLRMADRMFRTFLLQLYSGIRVEQLTAAYIPMHFLVSLSDDTQRLIVTQHSGAIVEYPFALFIGSSIEARNERQKMEAWIAREVALERILEGRDEDERRALLNGDPDESDLRPDFLVYIDFTCRRLAFIFYDRQEALRFQIGLLLLAKLRQTDAPYARCTHVMLSACCTNPWRDQSNSQRFLRRPRSLGMVLGALQHGGDSVVEEALEAVLLAFGSSRTEKGESVLGSFDEGVVVRFD